MVVSASSLVDAELTSILATLSGVEMAPGVAVCNASVRSSNWLLGFKWVTYHSDGVVDSNSDRSTGLTSGSRARGGGATSDSGRSRDRVESVGLVVGGGRVDSGVRGDGGVLGSGGSTGRGGLSYIG